MVPNTQPGAPKGRQPIWVVVIHVSLVLLTIFVFLVIRSYGEASAVSSTAGVESGRPFPVREGPGSDLFFRVLLALTAIIITGQMLAKLFAYIHQPPVIGGVVAGLLLGPSFLGPEGSAAILPSVIAPFLGVIAQLGVVLYVFLVGVELNPALLKHRAQAPVAISQVSILVPFLMGALLALPLYPMLSSTDVPFTGFALFLGVALSITAFPMLARILTDHRLARTRLGVMALSCAAINDVTAWCLLAFGMGVVQAQMGAGLLVTAEALAFIFFMYLLGRPLLEWITRHWGDEPPWHADEHARLDGADRPQCWPGFANNLPCPFCHDGADGPGHDRADFAGVAVAEDTDWIGGGNILARCIRPNRFAQMSRIFPGKPDGKDLPFAVEGGSTAGNNTLRNLLLIH